MNQPENTSIERKPSRMVIWVITTLAVFIGLFFIYKWRISKLPQPELGIVNGRLKDCPSSPNCVCSQCESSTHQVDSISYALPSDRLKTIILKLITTNPNWTLITDDQQYLHIECRTKLIGYIDDLELLIDEDRQELHFRSASRVGYSDLGTNRHRVEEFQQQLLESIKQES